MLAVCVNTLYTAPPNPISGHLIGVLQSSLVDINFPNAKFARDTFSLPALDFNKSETDSHPEGELTSHPEDEHYRRPSCKSECCPSYVPHGDVSLDWLEKVRGGLSPNARTLLPTTNQADLGTLCKPHAHPHPQPRRYSCACHILISR